MRCYLPAPGAAAGRQARTGSPAGSPHLGPPSPKRSFFWGASAHQEALAFANGLVELMHVAMNFDKDHRFPRSTLEIAPSSTPGMVNVSFSVTEPAAVVHTLDGGVPTYASTLYGSAGIREGGERLTIPAGTRIHWF